MKSQFAIIVFSFLFLNFAAQIHTLAGNGGCCEIKNNVPATSSSLHYPFGLARDAGGNLYISETAGIRKLDPSGVITTVAGNGEEGYSGDGGPAINAKIGAEGGVAVDVFGNIYFCDAFRKVIRKIDQSGIITTIAGTNGSAGSTGDDGPANKALLNIPHCITTDAQGNIYFGEVNKIRKINLAGIVSHVAGTGVQNYSGDGGPAISASIHSPMSIITDNKGNLYFSDWGNHRVRKIDQQGIITTVAGIGKWGFGGDGDSAIKAELNYPCVLAIDPDNNLYIADAFNRRIRLVTPEGIIHTTAGTGVYGCEGEDADALATEFKHPVGLLLDGQSGMYILDQDCFLLRRMENVPVGFERERAVPKTTRIFPNPAQSYITVSHPDTRTVLLQIVNSAGDVIHITTFTGEVKLDTQLFSPGLYLFIILTGDSSEVIKVVFE